MTWRSIVKCSASVPEVRNPRPPQARSHRSYQERFQIFSTREIAALRRGGRILHDCLAHVAGLVRPGLSTIALDRQAESFIRDRGALPAFKGYRGFPATLCTSVNEVCVHGIPSEAPLREGDIVALDCGVLCDGLHTDACVTVPVGRITPRAQALLAATVLSLDQGLRHVRAGVHTGDVSAAIHETLREAGFDAVRALTGHGLGVDLHQFPDIPNIGKRGTGPVLPLHTIVAIEPISTAGSVDIREDPDGWTLRISDGSLSAHFENTVLVVEDGCEVLT